MSISCRDEFKEYERPFLAIYEALAGPGLGKNCVKKIFMAGVKMKLMLPMFGHILGW
jgi:hypothetical protein